MKYVVTGGAGFIGREVVRQLLSAGPSVSIYDDFSFGREANIKEFARHPQLQVTKGKVEDLTALHACVLSFRPDVVIHLAALHSIPYCNRHPLQTIRINVEGTYSVFDSCEQAGVSKVVMARPARSIPVMKTSCWRAARRSPWMCTAARSIWTKALPNTSPAGAAPGS